MSAESVDQSGFWIRRSTLLTIDKDGVRVTALDSKEYPDVATTQVPPDAPSTCNLAQRITSMQTEGVSSATTERCPHVPNGNVWITVSK